MIRVCQPDLLRRPFVWVLAAALISGCGAPESYAGDLDAGMEGPAGSGGRGHAGSGGSGAGGAAAPTGSGGAVSSGGAGGGATGSGGLGSGGIWSTGSGGGTGGGGVPATGGGSGSGGVVGTGGASGATGGVGGTIASGSGGANSGGSTGTGSAGTGGATTGGATGSDDPDLVLHYGFDESEGSLAADSASVFGSPRNANLTTAGSGGAADFASVHQVGAAAVALTANGTTGGGYVTMPVVPRLAPAAMTIGVWVYLKTDASWVRVFDIGTGTTVNMMLTTHASPGNVVRFGLTTPATGDQGISGTAPLPTNSWHHVAVVLAAGSPYTGRLYVDGVEVGSNSTMTLHPTDLGVTTNNWLGRSQFSADPYFDGYLDDFRVYRRALNADEIAAMVALR